MSKVIELYKDGYKVKFWMHGKGRTAEIWCDIFNSFKDPDGKVIRYHDTPCLQWVFPKITGNNIVGNSAIYLDQAILYAKNNPYTVN